MLEEFSGRKKIPDLTLSLRRIKKICDYRNQQGSFSLEIDTRLTAEFSDYPYEASFSDELGPGQLKKITQDYQSSYPIIKVSSDYFENVVGYKTQRDSPENQRSHYLIVVAINDKTTLVYDPFASYFSNDTNTLMDPVEVDKQELIRCWRGELEVTDTLWVEQTNQRTLGEY
ncbi:hypothetical protein [Haloferax volcanii]|uniref:hypothetical protein n=1 Tax=Haloferax volcanii TaxID=2246 RepID=UPI0023DAEFE4|nr:hypothetical protein [Haloferax lucentense]